MARLAIFFESTARLAVGVSETDMPVAGLLVGSVFLVEFRLLINDFFWMAMCFSSNLIQPEHCPVQLLPYSLQSACQTKCHAKMPLLPQIRTFQRLLAQGIVFHG
jgi:hypothetical protein